MICVAEFRLDGEDGVYCPGCLVVVVLPPPTKDLITFLCPLCNKRYTLQAHRETIERALESDPTLDPGE